MSPGPAASQTLQHVGWCRCRAGNADTQSCPATTGTAAAQDSLLRPRSAKEAHTGVRRRYRGPPARTAALMSDQPAPDDVQPPAAGRESLTEDGAQALRAYAARTREDADLLAGVLEDIALNGLPDPATCTPWEELRERKLEQLHAARGHVA